MKKQIGIFMASSAVAWMAFAQSPSPTPSGSPTPEATSSVSPSASPDPTESPSPEPTVDPTATPTPSPSIPNRYRCCVRLYRKQSCSEGTVDWPAAVRGMLPNDQPDVEFRGTNQSCPEQEWTVKWQRPAPYDCSTTTPLHIKTWTRLLDFGVKEEAECEAMEIFPTGSTDPVNSEIEDIFNELLNIYLEREENP